MATYSHSVATQFNYVASKAPVRSHTRGTKGLCSAETFVGIARSNFQQDMDNSPMLDTETISKLIQGSRSRLKILNVDFSTLNATAVRKYLQSKKLISKEYTMVDGADGRTENI